MKKGVAVILQCMLKAYHSLAFLWPCKEGQSVFTVMCARMICVCFPFLWKKGNKRGKMGVCSLFCHSISTHLISTCSKDRLHIPCEQQAAPRGCTTQQHNFSHMPFELWALWDNYIFQLLRCLQSIYLTSYCCKKHLHTNLINKQSHMPLLFLVWILHNKLLM